VWEGWRRTDVDRASLAGILQPARGAHSGPCLPCQA